MANYDILALQRVTYPGISQSLILLSYRLDYAGHVRKNIGWRHTGNLHLVLLLAVPLGIYGTYNKHVVLQSLPELCETLHHILIVFLKQHMSFPTKESCFWLAKPIQKKNAVTHQLVASVASLLSLGHN